MPDLTSSLPACTSEPFPLDRQNVDGALRGYPFMVRRAFGFASRMTQGRLDVTMPDGRRFRIGGGLPGPQAGIAINDLGFARGLVTRGNIGIAEAYVRGDWDSPDLTAVLEIFSVNQPGMKQLVDRKPLVQLARTFVNVLNRNTRSGARRNIHAHYDLGNAFYAAWLDRTMTYSSALFEPADDDDLAAAQTRKYRALAQTTGVAPDHHVLEIGCGWGGFAEYAAREIGCRVTGLTISREQFDFARKRVFEAGLNEKVDIRLQDYRDERGVFDRIASIEMLEAVGEKYWPAYFGQLRDRLRPGGRAGIQVITIQDHLFESYKAQIDYIRRHIFPGGMLPAPGIMRRMGLSHGLGLVTERVFGKDYAATLVRWRDRFRAAWPQITTLGFDERFRRHWEYYLAYCEAGFRAGMIDVRQMVFAKAA